MLKIWLDDEISPYHIDVQEKYGDTTNMIWAKNSDYVISFLKQGWVSHISFGYNLGDPSNGTGEDVANWIEYAAEHKQLKRITWDVHCEDIVGKAVIEHSMERAEYFWSIYESLS